MPCSRIICIYCLCPRPCTAILKTISFHHWVNFLCWRSINFLFVGLFMVLSLCSAPLNDLSVPSAQRHTILISEVLQWVWSEVLLAFDFLLLQCWVVLVLLQNHFRITVISHQIACWSLLVSSHKTTCCILFGHVLNLHIKLKITD